MTHLKSFLNLFSRSRKQAATGIFLKLFSLFVLRDSILNYLVFFFFYLDLIESILIMGERRELNPRMVDSQSTALIHLATFALYSI